MDADGSESALSGRTVLRTSALRPPVRRLSARSQRRQRGTVSQPRALCALNPRRGVQRGRTTTAIGDTFKFLQCIDNYGRGVRPLRDGVSCARGFKCHAHYTFRWSRRTLVRCSDGHSTPKPLTRVFSSLRRVAILIRN